MLAHTDLALSEIAYAVGFSDQSHLARHFRRRSASRLDNFGGRSDSYVLPDLDSFL